MMSPRSSASRSYHSPLLSCPRCGLRIRPRIHWLAIESCPRCLAHAHVAVSLIASPPSSEDLYRPRPTRRADRPGGLTVDRSGSR